MDIPLYRERMDLLRCDCGTLGCEDRLAFHAKCHETELLRAKYFDGVLALTCSVCNRHVARIAVARGDQQSP